MTDRSGRLRVALVAGMLAQGGAEKQLVYMARALFQAGVDVRVYSLTRGEFYESILRAMGIKVIWIGQHSNPVLRLAALIAALGSFRPHVLQSTHFYANLYVSVAGRLWRSLAIGAIRNDTFLDLHTNGRWGPWLLRLPPALLVNSYAARQNAESLGIEADAIHVLSNVIDLAAFDQQAAEAHSVPHITRPAVLAVARLAPEKRLDRFLAALAEARHTTPELLGLLAGTGPDQARLEELAGSLGLLPEGLIFLGRRGDIPALLAHAQILMLSSDHEGFANVLIEAMAARLPVITTPAGDAGIVVQDQVTGYVVPFDDIKSMAERVTLLVQTPELRRQLGEAGRQRVERMYSFEALSDQLLSLYRLMAERRGDQRLLSVLAT